MSAWKEHVWNFWSKTSQSVQCGALIRSQQQCEGDTGWMDWVLVRQPAPGRYEFDLWSHFRAIGRSGRSLQEVKWIQLRPPWKELRKTISVGPEQHLDLQLCQPALSSQKQSQPCSVTAATVSASIRTRWARWTVEAEESGFLAVIGKTGGIKFTTSNKLNSSCWL